MQVKHEESHNLHILSFVSKYLESSQLVQLVGESGIEQVTQLESQSPRVNDIRNARTTTFLKKGVSLAWNIILSFPMKMVFVPKSN